MKTLFVFLLIFISFCAFSQTVVPAGNVQGSWTLANSPYLIQGNVMVPSGQTLNIEPGVEVVFQGLYYVHVYGTLDAEGSANQPITFRAQDTTGWYIDSLAAGGWQGIYFDVLTVSDSSELKYCHFQDTKNGISGQTNASTAGCVRTYRGLHISYCKFFHNQSTRPQSHGSVIEVNPNLGETFEMDHCEVYNNYSRVSIIYSSSGNCHIHNNQIHHNQSGNSATFHLSTVLFEKNEVYENHSKHEESSTIEINYTTSSRIFQNKIHHNISQKKAALICRGNGGKIDIDGNLICNNEHNAGNCGVSGAGGAIHMNEIATMNFDSTYFIIRNNVIANNYSSHSGGAILVMRGHAKIMNNHFINNSAILGGAINALGVDTELEIKNNLFEGNTTNNMVPNTGIITVGSSNKMIFKYNWMRLPFSYTCSFTNGNIPAILDTLNNIIGTNPYMIAPTTSALPTDDATIANFNLLGNSPCINEGDSDTTGCYVSDIDFVNNPRLFGNIDIGAFEYRGHGEGISHFILKNQSLAISPNPAQDYITLTLPEHHGSLTFYDMIGKKLLEYEATTTEMQVHLPDFPNGIYTIIWQKDHQVIVDQLAISHHK